MGQLARFKIKYQEIDMKQQYVIIGRRWLDNNGNTYHSVNVYVNCKHVGTNNFAYGYEDQYKTSGISILRELGITEAKDCHDFIEEVGTENVIFFVTDAGRKRDL